MSKHSLKDDHGPPLSEEKREAILASAAELVAAQGTGAPTAKIAKRRGRRRRHALHLFRRPRTNCSTSSSSTSRPTSRRPCSTPIRPRGSPRERVRLSVGPLPRLGRRPTRRAARRCGSSRCRTASRGESRDARARRCSARSGRSWNESLAGHVEDRTAPHLHRRRLGRADRETLEADRQRARKSASSTSAPASRCSGRASPADFFHLKMSMCLLIYNPPSEGTRTCRKIWLITGSARGLGRAIVEAALAAGDRVVATARDPGRLADLREAVWRQAEDLRARRDRRCRRAGRGRFRRRGLRPPRRARQQCGLRPHRRLRADRAKTDFRAQIDTNFYGVVNLTRAALPVMREQRAGHIINISSVGGRVSTPGFRAYQAAKWAVGGFTEVLAKEVGAVRRQGRSLSSPAACAPTGRRSPAATRRHLLPDYQPSVGAMLGMLKTYAGNEIGDPDKIAEVIVDLTSRDERCPRISCSAATRCMSSTKRKRSGGGNLPSGSMLPRRPTSQTAISDSWHNSGRRRLDQRRDRGGRVEISARPFLWPSQR